MWGASECVSVWFWWWFFYYVVFVYSDTLCSETCLTTFCLLREKMRITGYFVLLLASKSSWHTCGTDSMGHYLDEGLSPIWPILRNGINGVNEITFSL